MFTAHFFVATFRYRDEKMDLFKLYFTSNENDAVKISIKTLGHVYITKQ